MAVKLQTRATALLLVAVLLQGTIAPAAADIPYFRLKSPIAQGIGNDGPSTPPGQAQFSYLLSGPSSGTVGQSYAATPRVAGATGTVSFSLSSGTLPPGVLLDPTTGAVSGTPQQPGQFSAAIGAVDAGSGANASASISIRVATAFGIVGVPSGVATVGIPYSVAFQGTGGTPPFSFFTSSVLPRGVSLGANGSLAGVPSLAGTYPAISITAKDADGRTASSSPFTVVVSDPLSISWTAASGRVGDGYLSSPSASGGHGPLFYVLNGSLPSGMSFSSSSGEISGVPAAAGDFAVQIAVGDQDGRSAQTAFETISIAPTQAEAPLTISGSPATSGQVEVAYTASFTAAGGSGTGYSFDLVGSPLPDGLTLSSEGMISGSPTTVGTFAGIQVRVTDAEAHSALSNVFSIIVAPAPLLQLSGNPGPAAQVGIAYTADFVAFEGSGAGYTFSSIGAPLPPGLSLSKISQAQASIAGTPSYVGSYSGLQIRVTDSAGHTADSSVFSIEVVAPPGPALAITGTVSSYATLGIPFSAQLTSTGGSGAGYVYSISAGALPTGLAMVSSGAIIGTPEVQQSSSFTVRATDSVGDIGERTYSVQVSSPLSIGGTPAVAGQGKSYSFDLASITGGGRSPYSYAVTSGELPAGMAISGSIVTSSGVSGGTSSATVLASDADGRTVSASLTFEVSAPTASATVQAYAVGDVPTVRSGKTFGGLLTTSIENPSWSFLQSPTTPHIAFEVVPGSGNFFATAPTVSSPVDVVVTPTASNGSATVSATPFAIQLLPTFVVSGGPTLNVTHTFVVGVPGSLPGASVSGLVGTRNAALYDSWRADGSSSGQPIGDPIDISSLCPGLSLDATSAVIGGTPTAPCKLENLRLIVSDSYDGANGTIGSDSTSFLIQVQGSSTAASLATAPHARTGDAIGGTLTTNFPSPTWSLSSTPSGMSFSTSGSSFSGIAPSVASRTDYVVTATATSGSASNSSQFSMSVAPQLSVAMDSVSAAVGSAVSVTPPTSGIGGSASYALMKNGNAYSSLATECPGLAFSGTTGTISGTPTQICSVSNLAVRVSDDFDAKSATTAAFQISITGNTATASLNSGGEIRGGGAITGALSTDVPGASWSFSSAPTGLTLTASGATFSGTAPSVGSQTTYSVTAMATSGSYSASSSPFSLTVDPALSVSGGPSGTVTGAVGVAIATTAALVPTGLVATASYQLLQDGSPYTSLNAACGLDFSGSTGRISGTPTKICTVSGLTIRVTDSRDNATAITSTPFVVAIDPALVVSASPPTGAVSESYSYTPSASGGSGSYVSWSVADTNGTLAALGLGLNAATGDITGTPTSAGSWTGTIKVTDSHGNVGTSGGLTIQVNPALSVVASITSATIAVGETWGSGVTVTATGGGNAKTFSTVDTSGTLSALGLSFSTLNGSITGVPTAAGTWTGTIKVTDPGNAVGAQTASITITVNPALSIVPSTTSSTGAAGESWAGITVTASGGAGTKTFTLVNSTGTLTALGLAFSASTGAISGTPSAAGGWTGAVVVKDPGNTTGAQTAIITITVNPALSITAATVATAAMGESWAGISPNRTGGVAPFVFSAVNTTGTLSALGLSVNPSTGAITGTPTATGSWTGAIKVQDAGNPVGAQTGSITITVNAALSIASSWPASCTANSQCSATFTASGGVPSAYAWTVPSTEGGYASSTTNCTAASSTCTVKWTPTAAGTMATTAIQVSDGGTSVSSTTPGLTVATGGGGGYTLLTPTAVNTTFTYTGCGACTSGNSNETANQSKLYDGNDASNAADPASLTTNTMAAYDLGAPYAIVRARLVTGSYYGFTNTTVFKIQYNDTGMGGPWTDSGQTITASAGTAKSSVVDFSFGTHRYWRIASPTVTGGNGWLAELGFYTSP